MHFLTGSSEDFPVATSNMVSIDSLEPPEEAADIVHSSSQVTTVNVQQCRPHSAHMCGILCTGVTLEVPV